MRCAGRNLNDKGFTLVEVVVVMILLTAAIIPAMRLFSLGSNYVAFSQRAQIANELAFAKLEEITALNFDKIVASDTNDVKEYFPADYQAPGDFRYKVDVGIIEKDLRGKVTVAVYYHVAGGDEEEVSFSTEFIRNF